CGVHAAQLINEPSLLGCGSRPHPTLSHRVQLVVALLAPESGFGHEVGIDTIESGADEGTLLGSRGIQVGKELGGGGGVDAVKGDPQPTLEELARGEAARVDADA